MKRTLVVATTSYAGMGPYVSEIVNIFTQEDEVYFLFRDHEDDYFRRNIKVELHPKSEFYKKANSNWNKLIGMFFADKAFEKQIVSMCQKHDIKVVHYINSPVPRSIIHCLERMGICTLGTVHDLHPHEAKKALHKMFRAKMSARNNRLSMFENRNLVTNSLTQVAELKQMFPDKQVYYHAFPSLVTTEIINGKDIPLELKDAKKPYILFFGRIEEYKGVSLLYNAYLSSAELRKKYILVIAGKGDIGFVRKNNEQGIIWIHRYIKDTEIRYLYEHAACVVYPYISATQSGVLSLPLYFGTPTLASDVPFFKSIIEQTGIGHMFRNGDVEDLCKQVLELLHKTDSNIKNAGKDFYKSYYDSSLIRKSLISIYGACMNSL